LIFDAESNNNTRFFPDAFSDALSEAFLENACGAQSGKVDIHMCFFEWN